ncbi:Acyl-CoA N-acyltransferases (Nat) [Apiospora kogelbergensis]|uniref:Acyl-CoA N-acyltransferases (Nat) n=1 Tax=Apiospora kogelbergensis TaxID=1337665 RepID=UPI00312CF58A
MESSGAAVLTPDVTGAAAQGRGASPAGEKPAIILVPWDPDAPDHVERMRLQRVACGWKQDSAETWRPLQREGKIGLHWIVLSPSHPETASRVAAHKSQFPDEAAPLRDTCRSILGRGHTVSPEVADDSCLFVPVGHISLDGWHADPSLHTSAADGVYSLTTFYVSRAMQGVGIGGAAVAECERMAVHDFGAKMMTLDTISNEDVTVDSPRRIALKRPILKVTNQDWYVRRGYEVYQRRPNAWFDTDAAGKEWWCTAVCLRKTLV